MDIKKIEKTENLSKLARDHLWLHFTRHSTYYGKNATPVPIIVRGEGIYIYTESGDKKIDGLAALFCCQVGHGRKELADAASKQMMELDYFPLWSYAHPMACRLAKRLAEYAPGDLNRVFFSSSGSESVESAFKLAKQHFKLKGQSNKFKVLSRQYAYHGTTQGALTITGIPFAQAPFHPITPGGVRIPNTNFYRAQEHLKDDEDAFGIWATDRIEEAIELEGADSICALFLEPVQNSGGCFPPPPGYLERVREICTRNDILFVADETITAFGRLGEIFAVNRFNVIPDIITCAKGLTSGYMPLGAMIASDVLFEPFQEGDTMMPHGYTYGGHPVSCAVAMANLDIFEKENLCQYVRDTEGYFLDTLKEKLAHLEIVGDIRGCGFFYGIEMVSNKEKRSMFEDHEIEVLIRGFLSGKLFELGLYCRADDRGEPVIQLAPPLNITREEIYTMVSIVETTLKEAYAFLLEYRNVLEMEINNSKLNMLNLTVIDEDAEEDVEENVSSVLSPSSKLLAERLARSRSNSLNEQARSRSSSLAERMKKLNNSQEVSSNSD